MDRREQLGHPIVLGAPLDPDGALGHGGAHPVRRDGGARYLLHPQPVQAGHGEEGRVGHPVAQLAHPGLHVAAELHQLQVGAAMRQLRPAAQRRGADRRALGQRVEAAAVEGDEGVAHVLARQVDAQHQPLGLARRHVLHRMHRQVDAARQQALLDLAGEEALAPDLLEGAVEHAVAGGLDDDDLEGVPGQVVGDHQAVPGLVGLGQRQGRAAGADAQRLGRGGQGHGGSGSVTAG